MKKISVSILCLLLLAPPVYAECDKVLPEYASKEVMYVLCDKITVKNTSEAASLVKKVMSQYKGPPDEIVVQFVRTREIIGVVNPPPADYVAYYYTHSNELVLWPLIKSRRKTIRLESR